MKNIILYDAVCKLCNFSIQFIIKHDPKIHFHFLSIQSTLGQEFIKKYRLEKVDSLILIQKNQAFIYSDAVLKIVRNLDSWHRYLYIFQIFPKTLRDIFYKGIAKYRYRFFGKHQICTMPTAEIECHFINEEIEHLNDSRLL